MRKSLILLASAAGLALAAGTASAQATYSWGNSGTTYFYSPSTSDNYTPNTIPPAAMPDTDATQTQIAPAPPMFYQAPDSYSVYRQTPDPAAMSNGPAYYYNYDDQANLGQGSGIDDRFGR